MTTRYVVLVFFDDGDRFDYDPPLPHPAVVFLERFAREQQLADDLGASIAIEIDKNGKPVSAGIRAGMGPIPRGWLDES